MSRSALLLNLKPFIPKSQDPPNSQNPPTQVLCCNPLSRRRITPEHLNTASGWNIAPKHLTGASLESIWKEHLDGVFSSHFSAAMKIKMDGFYFLENRK